MAKAATQRRGANGSGRVLLVHLGPATESEARAAALRSAGYRVATAGRMSGTALRRLVDAEAPAAVVIDLGRVPSEGQAVALNLLSYRPTRQLPIVFVDGSPDKVAGVRHHVPEAVFVTEAGLLRALSRALGAAPSARTGARSVFDPYRGVPLAKKLGIKPGSTVVLVRAPAGFEELLGRVPEATILRRGNRGSRDLTVWFVTGGGELASGIGRVVASLGPGGLWIAWPKKGQAGAGALSQAVVQRAGLDHGLVDYKICSIDERWSALRFTRRAGRASS